MNGSTAIPILAASIANKFKERFNVVRELKLAVESSWTAAPERTPTQCCQVKNSGQSEYDSRFRSKVDLSRICVKVSKNAPASPTHVADSVVEKMKKISQDYPVLKWQYFVVVAEQENNRKCGDGGGGGGRGKTIEMWWRWWWWWWWRENNRNVVAVGKQ